MCIHICTLVICNRRRSPTSLPPTASSPGRISLQMCCRWPVITHYHLQVASPVFWGDNLKEPYFSCFPAKKSPLIFSSKAPQTQEHVFKGINGGGVESLCDVLGSWLLKCAHLQRVCVCVCMCWCARWCMRVYVCARVYVNVYVFVCECMSQHPR